MTLINQEVKQFYTDNPFPNFDISTEEKFKEYCEKFKWYYKTFPKELLEHASSLSLLDCGCGTGENSCMFAKKGFKVIGFDLSTSSIKKAKENAKRLNLDIKFSQSNVKGFNDAKEYDVVFCMGVLMYLANPKEGFRNIANRVKKGGSLIIGVYNPHGSIFSRIKARKELQRIYGNNTENKVKHVLNKNPQLKNLPNYRNLILDGTDVPVEKFFSIKEVVSWFEQNNLTLNLASPPIDFGSYLQNKKISLAKYSIVDSFLVQLIWAIFKKDFFVISGIKK